MPEARTLTLQRAMAALVLESEAVFDATDPAGPARRLGLPSADQQAFSDQAEGMLTYRELARTSLVDPLEAMFPVLRALLDGAGAWGDCTQAFLEARAVRSTHYRDIAPTFLGWLAETGWGQDRWPFLLELAHAELLEVLVARFPDSPAEPGLRSEPGPEARVVLDPATQVVSYTHAVHLVTEDAPVPALRPTHLLVFRDAGGEVHLRDLTPATAALLVRAQAEPLAEVAATLALHDLTPILSLLGNLRREGAIAGFRPPT